MRYKLLVLLLLALLLAGCSGPTATVPPMPTVGFAPPPTDLPIRVVTLSRNTPIPKTPTPSPEVTAPAAHVDRPITADGEQHRSGGPGALYPIVGQVATGTQLPAIAQSPGGEWLLITSPDFVGGQGWVYIHLTDFDPAQHVLAEATPPATPANPGP